MKKLLLRVIAIVIALTFIFPVSMEKDKSVCAKSKKIVMYSTPSIKSIKISINYGKKVSYYKIYKATLSKSYVKNTLCKLDYIPKKKYKLLRKTSKKKYIDKKVKKNKYYAYIVKGFSKKGKKVEEYNDRYAYNCLRNIGSIATPTLKYDVFDAEDCLCSSNCSSKKLAMFSESKSGGPVPTSFILYRKEEGKKKYRKLKEKKIIREDECGFICDWIDDKKVETNHHYYYKVKYCIKTKKKKYYSKMSNAIKLWAVDSLPSYDIECLTNPFTWDCKKYPDEKHEFIYKVADRKTNGKTIIHIAGGCYYNGRDNVLFNSAQYSFDMINWYTMSEEGIELPKNKAIYIRSYLTPYDYNGGSEYDKLDKVFFAGVNKNSYIYFGSIKYDCSLGRYAGEGMFDFGTKSGTIKEYQAD